MTCRFSSKTVVVSLIVKTKTTTKQKQQNKNNTSAFNACPNPLRVNRFMVTRKSLESCALTRWDISRQRVLSTVVFSFPNFCIKMYSIVHGTFEIACMFSIDDFYDELKECKSS